MPTPPTPSRNPSASPASPTAWAIPAYWLSEHHNTTTLAGAAPEILIARLAAETHNIRLGSGGIMLPTTAPESRENFRLLEALYPGRIDLGLGRARAATA